MNVFTRRVLYLLFFLSGVSGLGQPMVWTRIHPLRPLLGLCDKPGVVQQ